jgi:phospholipid-binding lipoprotein MlaA
MISPNRNNLLLHFVSSIVNHPLLTLDGSMSDLGMPSLKRFCLALLLAAVVILSGGAAFAAEPDDADDPLESMNRKFFDFDMFLDRILVKPVAKVYVAVVPPPGRHAIRHVLDNMGEPVVFANNLLQGEFHRADITMGRFLLNSTFGLGGIFDLASQSGLPKQSGDFGQTLYVWGVGSGPYLFLPIIGPSNPRDAIGYGVDNVADPVGYAFFVAGALRWVNYARAGTDNVDGRSQQLDTLDELQKNAIDFYAEVRSLARQRRAIQLRHGEPGPYPKLDLLQQPQESAKAESVK